MSQKYIAKLPGPVAKALNKIFVGPASDVFKGMATLAMGSGLARIVSLGAIPIITRIYDPEDYGILALFTALVALLVPIITLRYVVAIPLPKHDGVAVNLMALNAMLIVGMTAIVWIVLWLFGASILGFFSMEALAPYWWLIGLGILGAGCYEVMSMWATRCRSYRIIAKTQILQAIVGVSIKIGLGLLAVKPLGLLLGQFAAQSSGTSSLYAHSRQILRSNIKHIKIKRIIFLAGYYRGFPFYRLPSQVLLVLSMQAPLLISAAIYGTATTGQLGLAIMALGMPMNLIGQAMGKAYYAEIAALGKGSAKRILDITKIVQIRLFFISIPIVIVLFGVGPELFKFSFGEKWEEAGLFASILSIYLVFQFTSSPLMQVFNIYNKQMVFLSMNIFRTFFLLILFAVFYFKNLESLLFVWSYSVIMSAYYLVAGLYVMSELVRQKNIQMLQR